MSDSGGHSESSDDSEDNQPIIRTCAATRAAKLKNQKKLDKNKKKSKAKTKIPLRGNGKGKNGKSTTPGNSNKMKLIREMMAMIVMVAMVVILVIYVVMVVMVVQQAIIMKKSTINYIGRYRCIR